jgi:predicted secreted protein
MAVLQFSLDVVTIFPTPTRDVETKLTQGAITKENASQIRKFMAVSGRVLVEVALGLIGLFVPEANTVGELGK